MVDAIISRTGGGSESVTLPLVNNENGLAVARDIIKSSTKFHRTGGEDPEPADHQSANDVFTVVGELRGSNAYSDAKTLVEDIIKRRPQSSDHIQLDLTALPSGQTHDVTAASAQAITVTYPAGVRQNALIEMTFQAFSEVSGGTQTTQANLTPDSGSGVKVTDGTNSVTITNNLRVERTAGRPSGNLKATTADRPAYFDLDKPAQDEFAITGQLKGANAESDAQTLEETLIRARQGLGSLELHFLSNELGLDAYNVMPTGGQSLRTTFSTGETGVIGIRALTLRVVDPSE